jgi:hypothetical protein
MLLPPWLYRNCSVGITRTGPAHASGASSASRPGRYASGARGARDPLRPWRWRQPSGASRAGCGSRPELESAPFASEAGDGRRTSYAGSRTRR